MNIKTEKLSTEILLGKPDQYMNRSMIMSNEVEGVEIEYLSMKGPQALNRIPGADYYDVLLTLNGNAHLEVLGQDHPLVNKTIVKIPYDTKYCLHVNKGQDFNCLIIRKKLNDNDKKAMAINPVHHRELYLKALSDCPTYREIIKSDKTLNRMILPEGKVPRFCMGSVETEGPDQVDAHVHPMLDQLFFGLDSCKCTCYADGEKIVLTENTMLHIPFGSTHSVSVAEGNKMAYIWMDFFLTLEGEKYMQEQHEIDD